MTISEFKAWLEGFEEALAGEAPNKEQWDAIQKRIERMSEPTPIYPHPYRNPVTWPWETWVTVSRDNIFIGDTCTDVLPEGTSTSLTFDPVKTKPFKITAES